MRIFKKRFFEALLLSTGGRAHYAGEQANASVEQRDRGRLSARQDDVAEADLFDVGASLEQPFVEALKPPAKDGDAGSGGELDRKRVV